METLKIELRRDQYLELEKLALGAFLPLDHFMRENEFLSVAESMQLPSGDVFPLPVTFDVGAEFAAKARSASRIDLLYQGEKVGELAPESIYSCDKPGIARHIYGTAEIEHPGVRRFFERGDWFIGGKTDLIKRVALEISKYELAPEETKKIFKARGWTTVVGFQTRNVPHRAHEYLQRTALEHVDGLFIQPLIGQKKEGDYTPEAVMAGYSRLVKDFYPAQRVLLGVLSTSMRYAGPREALFHAIIRRNYGCTHFIIGRDHAGVGKYYGKYEAQALARRHEGRLGIKIMGLHGPYYCETCGGIVTEHTCPHAVADPSKVTEISGTLIRKILSGGEQPDSRFFRPEILAALEGKKLFVEKGDA